MTAILTTSPAKITLRPARLLLLASASSLVLGAQPLAANQLLFTTAEVRPETGERIDQRGGLTQIALTGGGTVSIVDAAKYRLNADGSIDLYEGAITVASGVGGGGGEVLVRMPQGLEGRVAGTGSAGNFVVRANGEASGQLAPMLERAATDLERDAERRLSWFAALVQPALIVLMGAIVLVLVLAVMLPIVSMNQLIR